MVPFYVDGAGQSNYIVAPVAQPKVQPGLYKTEPYSCVVLVPGPQMDDRSIVNPGGGHSPMPTITPGLRFIPYRPGTNR